MILVAHLYNSCRPKCNQLLVKQNLGIQKIFNLATLSCSVSNTIGLIDLKFFNNLRIAKFYRIQKVASACCIECKKLHQNICNTC
ncbi:hypothetical protein O3M35_000346 [Rhynocoris fuscipes]|uniref:Uncharacterized protein n=1 Tax=Rhynocoris fuscipes TaxID=488301 RepID=A0AAW1DR77_9HEMI